MAYDVGAPSPSDIFSDHRRWSDIDDWNQAALRFHESGGIHRVERQGFDPFWAVVGHTAVLDVERDPELFTNGPHKKYRNLTASWFKPSNVRRLDDRLDELSRQAVEKLEALGGECDFAVDIALPFPLQVILKILGLPEEDYPRMLTLTQQLFGSQDPDLQRDAVSAETRDAVNRDFFAYFSAITEDRRKNPSDDLASLIANGEIDDAPMPDLETLGYYIIIATAGHDTTSSAMAGGLRALIENPDQLRKLQDDPSLINNAVEEMLRWTSPVRHFMRTAQADTEVCGQEIKKGDWLYLSYKAANIDPSVFEDPLTFDIERDNADRHISFGFGAHFCLGAQLARNELRRLFGHIIPRIDTIELAGEPATMQTTFVGGHKTLPIRYTLN